MNKKNKNSILIVDDNKSNIMTLTQILSPEYEVYAAISGQKAIKAAEVRLPDVILLDILMPEMDGYAVLAALKSSANTSNIPVIFITGLQSSDDEKKGLALGAADYISKPFSSEIVKLRVRNQIIIVNQMIALDKLYEERSNRVKSEFLSRISHEMRTPMNAIIGMTRLALNTMDPAKKDAYMEKSSVASRHLMRLIDDMLDICDISENTFNLNHYEFNFADMITESFNLINADIKEKQQTLLTYIDPLIPETLIGDEKRLIQVIGKLLSNACKFTNVQGQINLNAFAKNIENDIMTMQFEVVDNGIGISKEHMEALFVPFEQADGGIDRKFGGAGLGLPISKNIIERMNGEIWVESTPEKGSKFIFTVKLQIKAPEAQNDLVISFEGKTALLVDDVEINRDIIMAMLESTRIQIECAVNGYDALEIFSRNPEKFNIIIMDINMPEMDGIEASRRIRAISSTEGMQIPIIAMTANVLPDEVEKYLSAGMNDHIGKPVDFDQLLSLLKKYLF